MRNNVEETPMSRLIKSAAIGMLMAGTLLLAAPSAMGQAGDGPMPSFLAARRFGVGAVPVAVAVGDLNGDGTLDLATANFNSFDVSILLGNGDGTFRTMPNLAVSAPGALAWVGLVRIGDFNGDAKPDLVVTSIITSSTGPLLGTGHDVAIFLGNGDGTFQAPSYFGANVPGNQAAGDLNGDGKLDLIIPEIGASDTDPGDVAILLGNGDGTFTAKPSLVAGTHPVTVVIADFNGDGKPDLAVNDTGTGAGNKDIWILLGNGDGTFAAASPFAAATTCPDASPTVGCFGWLVAADVNGDGKVDVAVSRTGTRTNDVAVLLGDGNGNLGTASFVSAGATPLWLAAGDFDGDGALDFATANPKFIGTSSGNVSILLRDDLGGFAAPTKLEGVAIPESVEVGDFNGDGNLDLVVGDGGKLFALNNGANDVAIILGRGDGTFMLAPNVGTGTSPQSVAISDFNADGKPDLAVANRDSNDVSIRLGTGGGGFGAASNIAVGTSPQSIAVGEFNFAGGRDLAVANAGSNNVSILLGNGNGTFGAPTNFAAGTSPQSVAIGDFNLDGKVDLAVANAGSNNASILLGNGNGTFGAPTNFAAGTGPQSVAVGDFNLDAKPDVVVANAGSDNVSILLGDGHGGFAAAVNYGVGASPQSVAVGYFNFDGKPDLAVANGLSDDVSILLGHGDGTFGAATNFASGKGHDFNGSLQSNAVCVKVGDFNGDGKVDLAVANALANDVAILSGRGNGTFAAPTIFGVEQHPSSVAIGDFDADARFDLAVTNAGSDNVSILSNLTVAPGPPPENTLAKAGNPNTNTGFLLGINGSTGLFEAPCASPSPLPSPLWCVVPISPPVVLPASVGGAIQFDDRTYTFVGTPINVVAAGAGAMIVTGQITGFTPDPTPPGFGGSGTLTIHLYSIGPGGLSNGVLSFDGTGPFTCPPSGCNASTAGDARSITLPLSNASGTLLASIPAAVLSSLTFTLDGFIVQQGSLGSDNLYFGAVSISGFQGQATPAGSNVTVTTNAAFVSSISNAVAPLAVTVTYSNVTGSGQTTVSEFSNTAGFVPSNFAVSVDGYQATFFDVVTTASVTGPITVCSTLLDHDGILDGTNPPLDVCSLHLLHYENGTFVDRTPAIGDPRCPLHPVDPCPSMQCLDPSTHVLCASVDTLSPFVAAVYLPALCGNGLVDSGEQCDDDNLVNGDGCSATCQVEPCWSCSGQPSVCTPQTAGAQPAGCTGTMACNGAGTCALANGQTCSTGGQCGSGACATGVCGLSNGQVCTSGDQCASNVCGSGTCQGLSAGQSCISNPQCASGTCDAGLCAATSAAIPTMPAWGPATLVVGFLVAGTWVMRRRRRQLYLR
jgi:cysteine-rich repeat protein